MSANLISEDMSKTLNSSVSLFSTAKKIWALLPENRKRGALRLWFLMMVGMVFELIGLGLVLPVMAILLKADWATEYVESFKLIAFLAQADKLHQALYVMSALVLVYIIKNTYLAFLTWQQSRFIFGLQAQLSERLFTLYLHQPYIFHLNRNSAILIRNIQGEMSMLINSAFSPLIQICAEGLIVFGLCCLLFYVAPVGTLAVFSMIFIFTRIFQKITKNYIAAWGQARLHHEGVRIRQLQQGLGGVKDIKLYGREPSFIEIYSQHTQQSTKMNQRQMAMQQMPRLFLEILAVIALSIMIIGLQIQGKDLIGIIPTLALFMAVAFRLMPSVNRILSALQQFRFGLPAVNLLSAELSLQADAISSNNQNDSIAFDKKINIKSVTYSYSQSAKPALKDISLEISKGQTIGFVGTSGSGKSTLIDLILGLLSPSSGDIEVDGKSIFGNLRSWQDRIGYVPQTIYLTDDTLRRNVAFGLPDHLIDESAVTNAIKAAQLDDFVQSLPNGLDTVVGERGVRLSGGQRQRIGIARALYNDPEILVLDEATSALDHETELEVMKSINHLHGRKTILLIAHRITTLNGCDRIYNLDGDSGLIKDSKEVENV